ncbi:MAG: acyl-CoA dehydrogenase family protein [Actinomycetota bacterium]
MERTLFTEEHEQFRAAVRTFVDREVVPHIDEWETAGVVSNDVWKQAGEAGFLGMAAPEHLGGGGVDDFRFNAVLGEELTKAGPGGAANGFTLHNDIVLPYLLELANDEQQERWVPQACAGDGGILAVAMTEPGTGSDLGSIATTALRDGDDYIVNGSKTFISNGIIADLVVTAVKTDPSQAHRGVSLLVIERGMEGFERGRNLDKVGLHAQDTAELSFTDVRVPVANRLGDEGTGFFSLMDFLPQERLSIALNAVAACEQYLDWTVEYCTERRAFGQPIGSFQNSKFVLAEMRTEIQIARVFVDRCIEELVAKQLTTETASMAKWWCTELRKKVVDQCVQLHGGYGYMREYPIARAWTDTRIETIYGGTTEIMKEIIGRSMGF